MIVGLYQSETQTGRLNYRNLLEHCGRLDTILAISI